MSEPLRVVYILLHFPYLTETFVAEEIRAMQEQGVNVKIVSLLSPGQGPVQQVSQSLQSICQYASSLSSLALWQAQLYYLVTKSWCYLTLLSTLLFRASPTFSPSLLAKRTVTFLKAVAVAHQLRHEEIDLFHSHFAWLPGAGAWVCARLLERPFTVTTHAYDIYASSDLLKLVTQNADHVITISDYNRHHLVSNHICTAANVSVVHMGIAVEQFVPTHTSTHETIPLQEDKPLRILSVGSLNHKKGHQYLIKACHRLKTGGVQFTCNIIGTGGEEHKLQALIKELALDEMVTLVGALPNHEIMQHYQQHDLFVLAAVVAPNGDRDGIPVVMMEAGIHALPLISTKVSGIPELVRPNQTGLLVPPENVDALADAIVELAADPSSRKRLGQNAQALVQSEFNVAVSTSRLVYIFQTVVDSFATHQTN